MESTIVSTTAMAAKYIDMDMFLLWGGNITWKQNHKQANVTEHQMSKLFWNLFKVDLWRRFLVSEMG